METDKQSPLPPTRAFGQPIAPKRIVIVGASVRALAESAARAGQAVFAADLFGDRDLLLVASEFRHAAPYPTILPAVTAGFPAAPCLFTGGLENHPEILAAIAAERPLAGASLPAIRWVRDPARLRGITEQAGLQFPDTRATPAGLPTDGSWLLKPRASAGGRGIRLWRGWCVDEQPSDRWQWQQRVTGQPWSAAFLINPNGSQLIGVCRQLVGRDWASAKPFHWCGGLDLAPESLPTPLRQQLDQLGCGLASVPGLVGLVGVDLIRNASRGMHVIEINPRPTASMELIERTTGLSLVTAQLSACGFGTTSTLPSRPRHQAWSKAILFAPRPLRFDDRIAAALDATMRPWTDHDGWSAVSDLPLPPQTIPAGRPVCTVFACGPTVPAALQILIRRTTALARTIQSSSTSTP